MAWTPKDIPDQTGKTIVITGANSGIGYHAAKHLVARGARVILACRRLDAAQAAADKINGEAQGQAVAMALDLEDFASIDAFVDAAPKSIDVLINNAGVMGIPYRLTPQGHEAQWGINVVGHARLTKALLPRIRDRVVTISSLAHRRGAIEPATFGAHDDYGSWKAYAQSKLGDMVFGLALQEHLTKAGSDVISVVAHPGVTLTRLAKDVSLGTKLLMLTWVPFLQGGDKGAWPTLRAATDAVAGGTYWGPAGRGERGGPPAPGKISKRAHDADNHRMVWDAVWNID